MSKTKNMAELNDTLPKAISSIKKDIKESEIKLISKQSTKINQYVTDEMMRQHIPGMVIGVYTHGDVLFVKGYGVANLETNFPITPKMPFCIGSIGKQFTSAAIMKLVEDHKIRLDDSITKYFPNSKNWKKIKIENLLSHTSGLSDYTDAEYTSPAGPFDKRKDFSEEILIDKAKTLPIIFKAGEKWKYCNTNYMILGVLIHKVTNKFWFDYLQDTIFKPLDMTSPRLVHKNDDIKNLPSGYDLDGETIKKSDQWSDTFNSTADGCFYCNVFDLAKWDKALYNTKLLSQSSLDKIWTIFKLNDGKANTSNYGFGWEINSMNGHRIIEHSGGWVGFETHIARYVDDSVTVVVLKNLDIMNEHSQFKTATMMAHDIIGLLNLELIQT